MAAAPDTASLLKCLGDSLHKTYPAGVKQDLSLNQKDFH